MANFGCYFLVLFLSLHNVQSLTETYNFQDGCYYNIYYLDDDDTNYVKWDGSSVESSSCSMEFHGRDDDILDEFKICIEAVDFDISSQDCNVNLDYKNGISSVYTERYGCYSYPSKWCSESDGYVSIVLEEADFRTSGQSNFMLKVTATKTYSDQGDWVYVSIGCGIGGIVLLTLVLTVVLKCVINRRRVASQYPRLSPNSSVPYQSINTTQNPYQSTYGVENPSKVFTHPPPYGSYGNSFPAAASSTNARVTPPPPYTTPTTTTATETTTTAAVE